jgi:hypothetical protein
MGLVEMAREISKFRGEALTLLLAETAIFKSVFRRLEQIGILTNYFLLIAPQMLLLGMGGGFFCQGALSLPPPEDIPEEILRTEIITEGRSPLDGSPLTATEYWQLEKALQIGQELPPSLSPQIRHLIFLLRVRRFLKPIFPFIP